MSDVVRVRFMPEMLDSGVLRVAYAGDTASVAGATLRVAMKRANDPAVMNMKTL